MCARRRARTGTLDRAAGPVTVHGDRHDWEPPVLPDARDQIIAALAYLDVHDVARLEVDALRRDLRSGRLRGHAAAVSVLDVADLVCSRHLDAGDVGAWQAAAGVASELAVVCVAGIGGGT